MPKKKRERFKLETVQAQKLNKEEFPSFKYSDKQDFIGHLLTNQFRNTFYVSKEKLTEEAVKIHKEMVKKDKEFYAKALVYARQFGYQRLHPVFGLVNLSAEDKKLADKIFKKIILIPTDLSDFLDVSRSKIFRKGIGSGVKKTIKSWIKDRLSEYYAMKYSSELRDGIRLSRPSSKYFGKDAWITDYIMENENVKVPRNSQISWFEKLKNATNDEDRVEAIKEGKLPWEVVTVSTKMTKPVWEEVAKQMPHFALIRHLNTFRRHDLFTKEFVDYLVRRIDNEEAVAKGKMFPFRYFDAYKMLESDTRTEWYPEKDYSDKKPTGERGLEIDPETGLPELMEKREEPKVVETFDKEAPKKILEALENAFKYSFKNIPDVKGRTAVLLDISSSMEGKNVEIASTLGIGLLQKTEKAGVICFNDSVHFFQINKNKPLKTIQEIRNAVSGGTSISIGVEYLTQHNISVDNIVVISDMEEWLDEGFEHAFKEYKNNVNQNVKGFLINITAYGDSPTPVNEPNIYQIHGWSDKILNFIAMNSEGLDSQVKAVEKVEI